MRDLESERTADGLIVDIYKLFFRLGISVKYVGFSYAAQAIHIAVLNPERLHYITKEIYMEVAIMYKTNPSTIEHAIRRVISVAWKRNAPLLKELANYPLEKAPSASEFLSILSMHIAIERMFNENT